MTVSIAHLFENCSAAITENEMIAPHVTVRVGGPARVMAFPADDAQLCEVVVIAQNAGLPWRVLGGGANLFADSAGYDGVVINTTRRARELEIDADGLMVVGAGESLRTVAEDALALGWCGIDFMAEVPGSIGGAVVINAGTNVGGYVADRCEWVETRAVNGETRRYRCDEMEFDYRTSRLLHGSEVVLRAAFRLPRAENPAEVQARFDAVMKDRRSKFPLDLPNFGSTFRSPGRPLPPAGKLIDDLGMKGLRHGNAQISEMHGNFIVNLGEATSGDILSLMQKMHDAVFAAHGVRLRPEVHYLANPGVVRPTFFPVE